MKVIDKKVSDLIPYENNPRNNDEAVDAVAASIMEFGFKVPIVISKDNVIAAGHTRLKAAQKLGIESVPCIVADDLTDEQIKAFRLADNKVGELATWNIELLDSELADIPNIDMAEFGFIDLDEPENVEVSEDDFDESSVPEEPKSKRGDVYKLGDHRLMCGDSASHDDFVILMGGG